MLQAVVLGFSGVLASWDAVRRGEIAAATAGLSPCDTARAAFAAAAGRRHGEPAWIARALVDAGIPVEAALGRQLVLAARSAPPLPEPHLHRDALRSLARRYVVGLLDGGVRERMEAWLEASGMADLFRHRLCIEDLGACARPPRPTAFRFLARRLDLAPQECLYAAGTAALAEAAATAGWHVVRFEAPPAATFDWETCFDRVLGGGH
jgi:FMN phosphatase YigB (HAD superfamily)